MPIVRQAAKPAAAAPAKTAAPAKPAAVAPKAAAAAPAAVQPSASNVGEQRLSIVKTLLENGTIKGEPVTEEQTEVRLFATATATAAYGLKMRKNLGNYESVEVSVFLSVPCYAEDIDNTQGQVIDKVSEVFNDQMTNLDVEAFRSEVLGAQDFPGGEAGDGTEAEVTTDEGAEEEVTPDWFDAASREEIVGFLETNPIADFNPDDYPDDDDLRTVVKGAFFPDEEGAEAAATDDGQQPYTAEELGASSMDDLKTLWETWEMGKFPVFTAKTQAAVKKNVITKILAKQDEANAG